jgi:Tfp pilus assembly protein FimT
VSVAQSYKFPGKYSNQGVPDYAESQRDVIDTSLKAVISKNLPENKPVPQYHPDFISQKSETDVVLVKQSEVWVTFVHEEAGFTNVLGFYTYDSQNPPKSVADIKNPTIIFPNVSYENSGGGLKAGTKVKIGKFEAGTSIGWFLIANGWQNGAVTRGLYTLYSELNLNPESNPTLKAHTVLLNDQKGGKLILGFEDTRRDQNSDNDFNDVLFYVTLSQADAINDKDVVVVTTKPEDKPGNTPQEKNTPGDKTPPSDKNNNPADKNNQNSSTGGNNTNVNTTNNNNGNNNTNNNTNVVTNGNGNTVIINNNTTVINNGGNEKENGKNNSGNGQSGDNKSNVGDSEIIVCKRQGLSFVNYEKAKKTIASQYVEENKKTVIKQIVRDKRISVSQVTGFIKILKVEQYRLEMAKYLFDFTCDKSNYYLVNNLLTASSTRSLDTYLQNKSMIDDEAESTKISDDRNNSETRDRENRDNNNGWKNNNNTTNNGGCGRNATTGEDLASIKRSIESKWFSDEKMTVLQQASENRCFSVSQVKEMMGLFTYETDKLKVAKFLYDFTGDKKNYYQVNDAFSFQSSIGELDTFIKSKK